MIHHARGFSLIEVAASITILGVMIALCTVPGITAIKSREAVHQQLKAEHEISQAHQRIVEELRRIQYAEGGGGFQITPLGYSTTGSPTTSTGACFTRLGPTNTAVTPPAPQTTSVAFTFASGDVNYQRPSACSSLATGSPMISGANLNLAYGTIDYDNGGVEAAAIVATNNVATADFGFKLAYIDVTLTKVVSGATLTRKQRVLLRNGGWSEVL